jgi:hypothetical protein
MLRKVACAFVLCVTLAMAAYAAQMRISKLNTWELDFSVRPPHVIHVAEVDTGILYTYVLYEVKNDTSQDVDFFPAFQAEDSNGKVYTAGIYPAAEAAIKAEDGRSILGFSAIAGNIKPGEKKRGMAIFKNVDAASNKLTLYVSGLSGDFKTDKNAEGQLVTMYRTYKTVYFRPGDQWHVMINPVTLKDSEWVWRE